MYPISIKDNLSQLRESQHHLRGSSREGHRSLHPPRYNVDEEILDSSVLQRLSQNNLDSQSALKDRLRYLFP